MLVTGNHPVCLAICDALGLKHVRRLTIEMENQKRATVTAEMYVDAEGLAGALIIMKKFSLHATEITEDQIKEEG